MNQPPSLVDVFRRSERWMVFAAHALVVMMAACMAVGLRQLLERLLPGADWSHLPAAGLLAAAEAALAYRVARRLPTFDNQMLVYRGVEWVVLLIVLKLWLELRSGGLAGLLENAAQWGMNFFGYFFTPEYGVTLFVILLAWTLSTAFAADLEDLEGDEIILRAREDDSAPSNRRGVHQRLLGRFLGVGVGLVVLAGLLRQDRLLLLGGAPAEAGSLGYVAAYFVLGLALLSLSNFAALRAAWGYERVKMPANLTARWTGHSLLFLGLLLVVALALPTSYALGFLPTVAALIDLIVAVLLFLAGIILAPLMLLFGWLMSLFSGGETEGEPLPPPKLPEAVPALASSGGPSWLEVLRSVVFWGLFLGMVVYAFYQYSRQNQALAAAFRRLLGWRWLRDAWGWLRSLWIGWGQSAQTAVQAGLQRLRAAARRMRQDVTAPQSAGWLNLRRLSPRQRVLFFYLALVRRGKEAGLPRQAGQTPLEYARTLAAALPPDPPGVEGDLAALTDAFVEARYSRHEVPGEQASRAQRFWERVRRAIRKME